MKLLLPVTVFAFLWQVDLKDNKTEILVCFIPQAVNITGRTDEGVSGSGRILHFVEGNGRFPFENIKHLCLLVVIMRSLTRVRWNGHDLKQVSFFSKVLQGKDDPFPV